MHTGSFPAWYARTTWGPISGRVAEHHAVGPRAEMDLVGQAQVIVHNAADALVGVACQTTIRVVGVLSAPA